MVAKSPNMGWQVKSAVIITRSSNNMAMLMKDLVRRTGWKVAEYTESIEDALHLIRKGECGAVVVDDSVPFPSIQTIATLMEDPLGVLTPMLAFVQDENRTEVTPMQTLGRPSIMSKPLTPDKFIPAMRRMEKTWTSGVWPHLRIARQQLVMQNEETGLRLLTKINEVVGARCIAAPCLAKYYARTQKFGIAEKVLLNALKTEPHDLGVMLALGNLYIKSAVPHLAKRVLLSARTTYGNSVAILTALTQAHLMLDEVFEASCTLKVLHNRGAFPESTWLNLCRTLYATGNNAEIAKISKTPDFVLKMNGHWAKSPDLKTLNDAS